MAGTIVADTLQDGAGNSTAMDNAIYGSAKAWVNFSANGGTVSIKKSYNVSSITVTVSGSQYTVNFTNALADANYSVIGTSTYASSTGTSGRTLQPYSVATNTASSCNLRPYAISAASNEADGMYAAFYD